MAIDRGPRLLFSAAMSDAAPPWLRRLVGGPVVRGIGDAMDTETDRLVEGVKKRFPDTGSDEDAIGLLGRERRILRGPGELGSTFAGRLREWWSSHRTRGGPYALLEQIHAFFLETNNVPIQYISNLGAEVTVAADGTFTRGTVAGWLGDGAVPPSWARFFLVLYLDGDTLSFVLTDAAGDPIFTAGGEPILVTVSIYALTAADLDLICSVPREWNAAHVDRIYIVLIPSGGIAWGLPPGTLWGDPGLTWGGGLAVNITC